MADIIIVAAQAAINEGYTKLHRMIFGNSIQMRIASEKIELLFLMLAPDLS